MHAIMYKKPNINPPAVAASINGYIKRIALDKNTSAENKLPKINKEKNKTTQTELLQTIHFKLMKRDERLDTIINKKDEMIKAVKDLTAALRERK